MPVSDFHLMLQPCPISTISRMMAESVARNFQLLWEYVSDEDARWGESVADEDARWRGAGGCLQPGCTLPGLQSSGSSCTRLSVFFLSSFIVFFLCLLLSVFYLSFSSVLIFASFIFSLFAVFFLASFISLFVVSFLASFIFFFCLLYKLKWMVALCACVCVHTCTCVCVFSMCVCVFYGWDICLVLLFCYSLCQPVACFLS